MTEYRQFRRYLKESEIHLNFKRRPVKAKMVDYSLSGIGTTFFDEVDIKTGDIIGIELTPLAITTVGKVMWTRRDNSGQRVGLKSLGQMKGQLRDFSLSDTFIGLKRTKKTGLFRVTNEGISRIVYYRDGDMIFAASDYRDERLGDMLVTKGQITAKQYALASEEMKKTKDRLGKVLVSLGYLTPRKVLESVWGQVEAIIMNLFPLKDGSFIFEERPLPTEELITLNLSTANLIYYGQKRVKGPGAFATELPSPESVLYYSSDPANLFQDLRLDDAGQKVISAVDHKLSISDIIVKTGLDRSEVIRTAHALLSTMVITTEKHYAIHEKDIRSIFSKEPEPDIRHIIEDMYGKYKRLNHYDLLGVKKSASIPEIRRAYYRAAKKFHPDIHFRLQYYQLKEKTGEIFSHINEAYSTLSSPHRRKTYDISITEKPVTEKPAKPARHALNPVYAKVKFKEGRALLMERKYAQAKLFLAEAVSSDETIAEYHYYYGMACDKLGSAYQARKAIEKAAEIEPDNSVYLNALANLCLKTGHAVEAKSLLSKAQKLSRTKKDS
ncbi:MAG: DnaJ domain-containing protein [Nitrospirae bacterium]|nr:DnaJ domain-containing protein [Nitrospirota bacterium]